MKRKIAIMQVKNNMKPKGGLNKMSTLHFEKSRKGNVWVRIKSIKFSPQLQADPRQNYVEK